MNVWVGFDTKFGLRTHYMWIHWLCDARAAEPSEEPQEDAGYTTLNNTQNECAGFSNNFSFHCPENFIVQKPELRKKIFAKNIELIK